MPSAASSARRDSLVRRPARCQPGQQRGNVSRWYRFVAEDLDEVFEQIARWLNPWCG